jgi:hypothetical protein
LLEFLSPSTIRSTASFASARHHLDSSRDFVFLKNTKASVKHDKIPVFKVKPTLSYELFMTNILFRDRVEGARSVTCCDLLRPSL